MVEINELPCVILTSSKLTFVNPEKEDLGIYSVTVTDTDGVSSSYSVNEEGQRFGCKFPFLYLLTMEE